MKRKISALLLTVVLLASMLIGIHSVNVGSANPYLHKDVKQGEVPPPNGTKPPEILLFSPKNNTSYSSKNVSFTFNVTVPQPNTASLPLSELFYECSWKSEKTTINITSLYRRHNNTFPFKVSVNFTDIPEGHHRITVNATTTKFGGWTNQEYGSDHMGNPVIYHYFVTYSLTTISVTRFTIDTTAPKVLILSVDNRTYNTPDVPLNFTSNEPLLHTSYSLDDKENVTITGNATLTELSNGEHSIVVYATDEAGNTASQTIYFNIAEPFPTLTVVLVSIAIVMVAVGILVYFKRRKSEVL